MKEPNDKTEKILKIINALIDVECVKNVTNAKYLMPSEENAD